MNEEVRKAIESLIVKGCEAAEFAVQNQAPNASELIRSVADLIQAVKSHI